MEPIHAVFSLRWKILAWFFVNLLVIGTILAVFLRTEFHVGIDSLLVGPTNDRLESIARPLATELRTLPAARWSAALQSALGSWHERGLRVGLYRNNGVYVAGDLPTLPPSVVEMLGKYDSRRHGPGGGPPGPPPGGGYRPDHHGGPAFDDGGIPGLLEPPFDEPFDDPGEPPGETPRPNAERGASPSGGVDGTPNGGDPNNLRPPAEPLSAGSLPKFMLVTDGPRR